MIYQFSGFILPFVIMIDIFLIGLVLMSTKPKKKTNQRIKYGLGVLGFLGFSLFKLLFTVPHAIPSTPVDLKIRTNSTFSTLYYLGDFKNETKVFWKEHIIGQEKEQYFDLESSVADGLTIARKFDKTWYSKKIPMKLDSVSTVIIEQSNFEKANIEIENAIDKYKWTELGNYFSNFLTLIFMTTLIWRIKKYGP
jgi:hypothetical protein